MQVLFILICILLYLYCLTTFIGFSSKEQFAPIAHKLSTTKDHFFLLMSFPFLLLIAGLRHHDIGCDTNTYIRWFQDISLGWAYEDFEKEKGYYFYNKLILLFSNNTQVFLFINSVILIIGYYSFIKRESKFIFVSVCLFIFMRYFDCCMNLLRQSLAIVIILYSYRFLKVKRFLPFLLCVLLASQFHYTSFFFLLAWPCISLSYKFGKKSLFVYLIILVVAYMASKGLISFFLASIPYYEMYEDSKYNHLQNAKIANVMFLLVSVFIILYAYLNKPQLYNHAYNKSASFNNLELENRLLFLFQLLATLFYVIALNFSQTIRIAYYFNVFSIVYLANILHAQKRITRFKQTIFLLMVFFLYYITIAILRPNWSGIYPYKFFFE